MYREKEERKEGSTRGRTEHCSKMGDKLSFFYGGGGFLPLVLAPCERNGLRLHLHLHEGLQ
jgi:hypothetical protein